MSGFDAGTVAFVGIGMYVLVVVVAANGPAVLLPEWKKVVWNGEEVARIVVVGCADDERLDVDRVDDDRVDDLVEEEVRVELLLDEERKVLVEFGEREVLDDERELVEDELLFVDDEPLVVDSERLVIVDDRGWA